MTDTGFVMHRLTRPSLDAMEWFERLVSVQKPADTPWQPVTDYSFEARKAIEGPHAQLIKDVFQPQYVLDVGAGTGVLAGQLRDGSVTVVEVDLHPTRNQYCQDITVPLLSDDGACYDLVICREVFEHLTLRQIRQAVTNLCRLSAGFVYVTTRFSSEHDLLRVETHDDLDPTHITIASKDLYRLLFVLEGFQRRADLEERMDWQHKNRCLVYERVRPESTYGQ